MPRGLCAGLIVCAAILGGCDSAEPRVLRAVSTSSGAVRTVMPSDWNLEHTFRRTDPAGEGLLASLDGKERMIAYASSTALQKTLGDNPNSAVYNFRHVQTLLGSLDSFPLGDGCVLDAIRPLQGAGFYGRALVMRHCGGPWNSEVRATLVDANRTTVLWVTVRADGDDALDLALEAVENVVVDREAVPRRVAVDAVTGD